MRCAVLLMLGLSALPAAAQLPPLLEAPARLGAARPADEPRIRPATYTVSVNDDAPRMIPDDVVERPARPQQVRSRSIDPVDEFLEPRPRKKQDEDRRSRKFGDRFADLFNPDKPREWLFSDHAFDCMTSPISNPFLAEDPRALTEIRPIFLYQKVPGEQPNFRGGDVWFLGARGSIALSERFSVTLNKLGGIGVSPGGGSPYGKDFGFAELWLGPKYTFWRDPQGGTVAAGGVIFQIPTGGQSSTFQNTGSLGITPYATVGKTLGELKFGSFNGISTAGYNFASNSERNEFFYWSNHLDFDVGNHHRFYTVAELNYFQYGKGGKTNFSGVGHDLINFGTRTPANASLVTGALGGRFKITEAAQIGGAFELPLLGNRDIFQYRFTMDLIIRY
jgi:hypothetical protein